MTLNKTTDTALAREVDDERRQVPDGWVRAFDKQSGHHFYAPTTGSEPTTWVHPYDNPTFLASLPHDHPANPNSAAAKEYQRKAEEEQAEADRKKAEGGERRGSTGIFAKIGSMLSGEVDGLSSEERRAVQAAEESYVRRRKALSEGDTSIIGIKGRYAPDPFAFAAPTEPFHRPEVTGIKYAYGYPGGYQRQYSPVYGYGTIAMRDGMLGTAMNSLLAGAGSPVPGHTKKTNYGYSG